MSSQEKTYEMFWDCAYCGTRKLLGLTHRCCPECGAAQNPEKRYFPPDNEKVAVEDHQYVGADVHCPACREPQSAAVKHCTNCGSPMGGGQAAHQQAEQVVGPGGVVQPAAGAAPPPEKKKSKAWIGIGCGVLILAAIALVVVMVVWKKETGVEVTGHSWTRSIAIERYDAFEEKGPCKDMPRGAKELKRSKPEPVCKTRKVDQGDGTFKEKKECSEPVAQCTYEVTKWKVARTLKETGEGLDSTPKWPEVKLGRTGKCEGCEREGDRKEVFTVDFVDTKSKKKLSCDFDSTSKWKKYAKGEKYKAKVSVVAGTLDCSSLKKK